MIRALVWLATCACSVPAIAQGLSQYGLSPDGARQLQELRLRRSQEVLLSTPTIEANLGMRAAELRDLELNQALLLDLSQPRAGINMAARVRMSELAQVAATPEGATAFGAAGWHSDLLRRLALMPNAPVVELANLQKQFGVDAKGRLLLRPQILMVNPERPAPNSQLPGQLPPGHQGPPPIWRRGLLFAVAIGTVQDNIAQAHCSGTIVDRRWVVTAGHCLNWGGRRLDSTRLFVFLPFQAGNLSVRNVAGGFDKRLRQVRVIDAKWVGDATGKPLPTTDSGLGSMVLAGEDVAILKLDEAEMNALPISIPEVKIVPPTAAKAPVSLVGYGLSNMFTTEDLSMAVGVRDTLPEGMGPNWPVYFFGAASNGTAGLCGGDSGGGLFVGRQDGAPGTARQLFGIINGLVGALSNNVSHCLSHQQVFTPLLSGRNHAFVCDAATQACPQNQ